jgi:hypothetical protein
MDEFAARGSQAGSTFGPSRTALPFHFLIKLLPFAAYFALTHWDIAPNLSLPAFLAVACAEFLVVKSHSGWAIVGLGWRVDPDLDGSIIQFLLRSTSFVPDVGLSNLFWLGFVVAVLVWVVVGLANIFHLDRLTMAAIGVAMQITNLLAFMRGHAAAQRQAAELARATIRGDSVKFALVADDAEESSVKSALSETTDSAG